MSATFMRVKGGGWINAAHVREITEDAVAVIPTNEPGCDVIRKLEDDWGDGNNVVELKDDRYV